MLCPHCRLGIVCRRRNDTGEWVHDYVAGKFGVQQGHTICQANALRQAFILLQAGKDIK